MSYTNVGLLRQYLSPSNPSSDQIFDQPLKMSGNDEIIFFNGAIELGTLQAKSIQTNDLFTASLTLQAGTNLFASAPIVRGNVLVASDLSQTTIYTENLDYIVDYSNGTLTIKSGGVLVVGNPVVVWYLPYTLYADGSDYSLDENRGTIRRLASGDIAENETIYLDYYPINAAVTDLVLEQAALEANGLIEATVDPEGQFGADPVLQSAATYRALEIVAYMAASRELTTRSNSYLAAQTWLKLADQFAVRADKLLNDFRPAASGPSNPTHS